MPNTQDRRRSSAKPVGHRGSAIAAFVAAMLALLPVVAQAQEGPLAPRDECRAVPDLSQLGDKVGRAVEARDADALLALVSDDILLDFGGGSGKAELRRRLDAPDYRLWNELDRALALGCGLSRPIDDGERYASWPWYFAADRDPPFDAFEAYIVTGEGVRLRAGPSLQARVIGSVSWDYVRVPEYPEPDAAFARVETLGGESGYMASRYLRSLVDYRLIANKGEEGWRITTFVAGD